jgi:hypothetical protein
MNTATEKRDNEPFIIHINGEQKGRGREKEHRTTDQLLDAIKGSFGNIKEIAFRLDVSVNTAKRLLNEDAEAYEEFLSERENILELSEQKLVEGINKGSERLIVFALTSRYAKNRAWQSDDEIAPVKGRNIFTGESEEIETDGGGVQILTPEKLDEIEKLLKG